MKIDQKENLCNTMRTAFMASAKQIAWRKKFARMSKAGKFKKSKRKPLWLKGSQASKMTDAQIIAKSKKSGGAKKSVLTYAHQKKIVKKNLAKLREEERYR